jgi:hypothetical protein
MSVRKTTRKSALLPSGEGGAGLRPDPHLSRGLECGSCSSSRVTRISMTLTDGSPVDFVSCHECEYKSWRGTDGHLALAGVLERARKHR